MFFVYFSRQRRSCCPRSNAHPASRRCPVTCWGRCLRFSSRMSVKPVQRGSSPGASAASPGTSSVWHAVFWRAGCARSGARPRPAGVGARQRCVGGAWLARLALPARSVQPESSTAGFAGRKRWRAARHSHQCGRDVVAVRRLHAQTASRHAIATSCRGQCHSNRKDVIHVRARQLSCAKSAARRTSVIIAASECVCLRCTH